MRLAVSRIDAIQVELNEFCRRSSRKIEERIHDFACAESLLCDLFQQLRFLLVARDLLGRAFARRWRSQPAAYSPHAPRRPPASPIELSLSACTSLRSRSSRSVTSSKIISRPICFASLRDQRRDRQIDNRLARLRRRLGQFQPAVPVSRWHPRRSPRSVHFRRERAAAAESCCRHCERSRHAAHFIEFLTQAPAGKISLKRRPMALLRLMPVSRSICVFQLSTRSSRPAARIPDIDRFDDVLAEFLQSLVFIGFALQRAVEPRVLDGDRNVVRQRDQQLDVVARIENRPRWSGSHRSTRSPCPAICRPRNK